MLEKMKLTVESSEQKIAQFKEFIFAFYDNADSYHFKIKKKNDEVSEHLTISGFILFTFFPLGLLFSIGSTSQLISQLMFTLSLGACFFSIYTIMKHLKFMKQLKLDTASNQTNILIHLRKIFSMNEKEILPVMAKLVKTPKVEEEFEKLISYLAHTEHESIDFRKFENFFFALEKQEKEIEKIKTTEEFKKSRGIEFKEQNFDSSENFKKKYQV